MPQQWKDPIENSFAGTAGFDAYVEWALRAAREAYFVPGGEAWASVMVQIKGVTAAEFAAGQEQDGKRGVNPDLRPRWVVSLRVPDEFVYPPPGIPPQGEEGVNYVMALVRDFFFEAIQKDEWLQEVVTWVTLGRPGDPHTLATPAPGRSVVNRKAGKPPPQGTVVMGVIDDGIAFGHQRFRLASGGTRVRSAWWQDGAPDAIASAIVGRERSKAQIDASLGNHTHARVVDEDALYRKEGLLDMRRSGRQAAALRHGHGAHVMDVACGYPPADEREDRPIVAVQLPAHVTADTSLHTLNFPFPYLSLAVLHILWQAHLIGGGTPLPVVINFSYGDLAGPHDGTSGIERALDFYIRAYKQILGVPLEIVLPAGNSHLSRCHAQVQFKPGGGEHRTLHWRILPDDRTWSFLEIWLPESGLPGPSRMAVSVATPAGLLSPQLEEDTTSSLVLADTDTGLALCSVTYVHKPAPTRRGMFLVAVRNTSSTDLPGPFAPSGRWAVNLHNRTLGGDDLVQLWVERDDTPYGYRQRGRQSYLDEDCYRVFDHAGRHVELDDPNCPVQRARSMNALATGGRTVVIGGFERREGPAARYSAGGPVTAPAGAGAPSRTGPDALADSEGSSAHRGVLAAGTRSGAVVAMQGTSVAAPRAARAIADELAKGPPYAMTGREIVAGRAAADDAGFPPPPATESVERRGAGRIDVPLPPRPPLTALRRFDP